MNFQKYGIKKIESYYGSYVLWDRFLRSEKVDDWAVSACDAIRSLAHIAAERGLLPHNFQEWELADENGFTVAHQAARWGTLPRDFDKWDIATLCGWSIAHEAAQWGTLPANFNRWDLATNEGWTVAHEAARWGNLPDNFREWYLSTRHGRTVADVAADVEADMVAKFTKWRTAYEAQNNEGHSRR